MLHPENPSFKPKSWRPCSFSHALPPKGIAIPFPLPSISSQAHISQLLRDLMRLATREKWAAAARPSLTPWPCLQDPVFLIFQWAKAVQPFCCSLNWSAPCLQCVFNKLHFALLLFLLILKSFLHWQKELGSQLVIPSSQRRMLCPSWFIPNLYPLKRVRTCYCW